MNTPEQQQIIDSFVAGAREYCGIIERAAYLAQNQLAEQCAIALADLYSHALKLPEVEPCDVRYQSESVQIPFNSQHALASLALQPREHDPEHMADTLNNLLLTDDLSDIYIELKRGLRAYHSGDGCAMSDAVWEWKFSFETHWREHLVHALYVLDRALRENVLPEEPGV